MIKIIHQVKTLFYLCAMKNVVIYFLVTLISLPAFMGMATYVTWKMNQEYIAKYLCVNKEKKELKCKGKCHLMKNLKETEQPDNAPIPQKLKEISLQPFIFSELPSLNIDLVSLLPIQSEIIYQEHIKISAYYKSIFTPPDFTV
jgi:hypothetical protein